MYSFNWVPYANREVISMYITLDIQAKVESKSLADLSKITADKCRSFFFYHARDVADRIIFMDQGVIVEEGAPSELFSNPKSARLRQFLASVLD